MHSVNLEEGEVAGGLGRLGLAQSLDLALHLVGLGFRTGRERGERERIEGQEAPLAICAPRPSYTRLYWRG